MRGRRGQLSARVVAFKAFERSLKRPPTAQDVPAMLAEVPALEKEHGVKPGWLLGRAVGCGGRRGRGFGGGDVGETPAVAAVVGGILAQEVLRSVTGKGSRCGTRSSSA